MGSDHGGETTLLQAVMHELRKKRFHHKRTLSPLPHSRRKERMVDQRCKRMKKSDGMNETIKKRSDSPVHEDNDDYGKQHQTDAQDDREIHSQAAYALWEREFTGGFHTEVRESQKREQKK